MQIINRKTKTTKIKLNDEKLKPLLDKLKLWCTKGQLEPRNYEVLSKMIEKCENYDDAISILEIATQSRKTGLFYRHQFEKIETNKIHYLEEDKNMSFGDKGIVNKLIIGDNYLSLENLLISYRNKIDVIYIDPPYGCNDMGEFAETNYENDINRDNLLSELSPRLELAHQLLSADGAIFISMDDKNQSYVKCLMDDLFSESNFVCNFVRQTRSGGGFGTSDIGIIHDYVICYAKNRFLFEMNSLAKNKLEIENYFNLKDKKGPYHRRDIQQSINQSGCREDRPFMFFPIFAKKDKFVLPNQNEIDKLYDKKTKKFDDQYLDGLIKKYEKIGFKTLLPTKYKNTYGRWTCGYDSMNQLIDDLNIEIYQNKIFKKERLEENRLVKVPTTILSNSSFSNNQGTKDLKEIFNETPFLFPKPYEFIMFLINLISKKDATILDFYAGSGTTGHAVLEMNRLDGGKRNFILCSNEDKGKGRYEHGIATDVTFERLKRIMTGKSSNNSKFKWIQDNEAYGQILKVYKVAEIENSKEDVFKVINPINYDYNCQTEKRKIEWICKNFEVTQKILEKIK